jgi:hypothetical protein
MFNPDTANESIFMPSLETAARSLKIEAITAPVHDDAEIETAIIALGRQPGGSLVVMPDVFTYVHRVTVILAAARNNVPAVYSTSAHARDGGLLSYGVDQVDSFRRAASYVDRILRGEKPGDLPVQFPTKFEMVLNLKICAGRPPGPSAAGIAAARIGHGMNTTNGKAEDTFGLEDGRRKLVREIMRLSPPPPWEKGTGKNTGKPPPTVSKIPAGGTSCAALTGTKSIFEEIVITGKSLPRTGMGKWSGPLK